MINPKDFYEFLKSQEIEFFTGVPDSQLKDFLDYLTSEIGIGDKHIIAANEGNAVALASGYHLATSKVPLVYMQNSGLGNAVNPITSLTDPQVYAIPVLYLIGHRGLPGVHDEPQHVKQGQITIELLNLLGVKTFNITKSTTMDEIKEVYQNQFLPLFKEGKSAAFVVQKGGFQKVVDFKPENSYTLNREYVIKEIIQSMEPEDIIVSTTGKISREVYEARVSLNQNHEKDFLTVGSMGHASMIALGLAKNTSKTVWCLDGDGAALMHMGALPTIGVNKPCNFIHVVLNNVAHESVGGQPTITDRVQLCDIARDSGYNNVFVINDESELEDVLKVVKKVYGLIFIEVRVSIKSREDLGRPKTSPIENKNAFMNFIK